MALSVKVIFFKSSETQAERNKDLRNVSDFLCPVSWFSVMKQTLRRFFPGREMIDSLIFIEIWTKYDFFAVRAVNSKLDWNDNLAAIFEANSNWLSIGYQ